MNNKIDSIVVSGQMVRDEFHTAVGAIRVYRRDDRAGKQARWDGHSNWGYSGYYLASIYDGERWRKLQFNKLVPYEDRSYERSVECPRLEAYLSDVIARWRGLVARYDATSKSFRILPIELNID
ncbi:hypothetical protein ACVAAS_004596 [Enterobacter roggenkampii]